MEDLENKNLNNDQLILEKILKLENLIKEEKKIFFLEFEKITDNFNQKLKEKEKIKNISNSIGMIESTSFYPKDSYIDLKKTHVRHKSILNLQENL